MDKSWIDNPNRYSPPYLTGIDDFLTFAYTNKDPGARIYCPCRKCKNSVFKVRGEVLDHLLSHGFWKNYKLWLKHGESIDDARQLNQSAADSLDSFMEDDMIGLVQDAIGTPYVGSHGENVGESSSNPNAEPNGSNKKFVKLMNDANIPLYEGSKRHTKMSFIVRLLQAKVLHGFTNKGLKDILDIFREVLPDGAHVPVSYYEAKKVIEDLGFTYKTIDACPNDCMLFMNEDINLDECLICKASRWKDVAESSNDRVALGKRKAKPVKRKAAKQARYFPLKPRLQRLFMSSETAKLMRWHAEERADDGVYRHPADSPAWKDFDQRHQIFSAEIRNIRLGLASDGFNPFGNMNITHSTWPILLFPYNLPPMMCLKQPFIFLSVLIDGPKAPLDKIDVYMQPLIEELKELWEVGVETFDASSDTMFQLRAALLWTINDFPGYANLSGWSTKGEYACPNCNSDKDSVHLNYGGKHSFMGSRRYLPPDHVDRQDEVSFGTVETRLPPKTLSGVEILEQLNKHNILTEYKRDDLKRRRLMPQKKISKKSPKYVDPKHNWKKRSIFFELPYWKYNLLRHNLDVMHTEKNFSDNVLWTILGRPGKTKDNMNSRRELQSRGIRRHYHVKRRECGTEYYDRADFEMIDEGKNMFLSTLAESRMPDGAASNIARRVKLNDKNKTYIGTLKSHDNHILLQQLIPLAIRNSLPKHVVEVLIDVGKFFKQLCSKVNTAVDLEVARDRFIVTLCELEKIFPPSFFDSMEHLSIHLVEEALIGGAVQFRWMYPIERYLLTLKNYVRNRAHPEASIANGYLMEECMNFCSQYLKDVETKLNRPPRRKTDDTEKGKTFVLDDISRAQIHRWVLFHTEAVTPFLSEHISILRQRYPNATDHQIQNIHFNEFASWLKEHVVNLQSTTVVSQEIIALSNPPNPSAKMMNSYVENGFFFRVASKDNHRSTQNSGVALQADVMSASSSVDSLSYYGKLTEIIKVTYSVDIKYVLFKCDWFNPSGGVKVDQFNFTMVKSNRLLYQSGQVQDEPFILASQAHQVWYVPDGKARDWLVAVPMYSKDFSHVQQTNEDESLNEEYS